LAGPVVAAFPASLQGVEHPVARGVGDVGVEVVDVLALVAQALQAQDARPVVAGPADGRPVRPRASGDSPGTAGDPAERPEEAPVPLRRSRTRPGATPSGETGPAGEHALDEAWAPVLNCPLGSCTDLPARSRCAGTDRRPERAPAAAPSGSRGPFCIGV